jgi:hypothetical protein
MVDLQTVIEELNTGKIEFDYKDDDCCTTEGEVVILLKRLAELENADVVEVKHGEWIWTENGEADYEQFWVCSVCKEKSYIKTKFCSDCGAKMDVAKNATTERRDT